MKLEKRLENRLHAIWEEHVKLELSLYDANTDWFETRPINASRDLHEMANSHLEIACELDAIACDLEAEVKRREEVCAEFAKGIAEVERDGLTKRLGEIVQTPCSREGRSFLLHPYRSSTKGSRARKSYPRTRR